MYDNPIIGGHINIIIPPEPLDDGLIPIDPVIEAGQDGSGPSLVDAIIPTTNDLNFIEAVLAYQYTPLAMASVQTLTGTLFELLIPGLFIPEIQVPIAIVMAGSFLLNRTAAVIGTASTFYQYSKGLYDVRKEDVAVSVVTTLIGTYPPAAGTMSYANLFWEILRTDWKQFPLGE